MLTEIGEGEFRRPGLGRCAEAVRAGLAKNYAEVAAEVVECPDLRDFGCAFAGLDGSPFLVEIGGEPLVHNPRLRSAGSFDLPEILKTCGRARGCVLGAGFPSLEATGGRCGELMPCFESGGINASRWARVGEADECVVEDYESFLHGGLGNLYVSDGARGEVLRVEARRRTGGEGSFSQALRGALGVLVAGAADGELGMGGVFRVLAGGIRSHISPDFERVGFRYYDEEREEVVRPDFLRFYDGVGPGLFCMSVFWTGDPTGGDLHLRASGEHTHFFSESGYSEGGHYHYDVSPGEIHYEGYFQLAERVFRVADIYAVLGAGV